MKEKKTIAFRVDASLKIGTGHVIRCLTLADALKNRNCTSIFLCKELEGNLIQYIRKRGYDVYKLSKSEISENQKGPKHIHWLEGNVDQDASETINFLNSIDVVIVDSYALDIQWEKQVRKYVDQIVVIDDLADRTHNCDFLVDQTYGRSKRDYHNLAIDAELFCGSRFSLLKPQFLAKRTESLLKKKINLEKRKVLVFMGGVDKQNATLKVLQALEGTSFSKTLEVILITGSCYQYREDLEHYLSNTKQEIRWHDSVTNMADFMVEADFAIGASGTTAWERCCLGLPTLMAILADNQKMVAKQLSEAGAVILFDIHEKHLDFEHKLSALYKSYDKMVDSASKICDGLGVGRVLQKVLPTYAKDGNAVTLRCVHEDDSNMIFAWQQHPSTRKFSRNPNAPIKSEHDEWFNRKLQDSGCFFLIIEHRGQSVGSVRLDVLKNLNYEVSIFVAPNSYGMHFALAGLKLIRCMFPAFNIEAYVLEENNASQKLFEKAGYERVSKDRLVHRAIA